MRSGGPVKTEEGKFEPQVEAAANSNLLLRLGSALAEMRINDILRFYRLVSLLLSCLLFLAVPGNYSSAAQLSLIFLMITASALMVILYEQFWYEIKIITVLITFEIIGISLLLAYTGGFHGPFLWYALNPFIVTTAFFPFWVAWGYMALLVIATFSWKLYLLEGIYTLRELFLQNYYSGLNLIVIVLLIQLFARMHMVITEQSVEKKSQQLALLSAYRDLSSNYEIFRSLSNFQRQLVSYKNQKDIYTALIDTLMGLFPFRQAVVLIPPSSSQAGLYENEAFFRVIGRKGNESSSAHAHVLSEIKERWAEFIQAGSQKQVTARSRRWIAVPLYGDNNSVKAIFVGWLKPLVNPLSFKSNLSLFISFAERTSEWLSMLKQKERVLQHVASIYEAVEAASGRNDPRMVIDLFASYARALTDCEKSVFWMENTSSGISDDYAPVFSIKGPRDVYPEETWKDTLLRAWVTIKDSKNPVVLDLDSLGGKPAQLIAVPVKTGEQVLGLLAGIQCNNTYNTQEIIQTLNILGDLSAIAVERSKAEAFSEKLLVIDEQKRIANEIHDTISQNLFSIVYSIDALVRQGAEHPDEEMRYSLTDIKNLSAETARDLRALIYRLNPRQDTNESFVREIGNYLDQTARMNRVQIRHFIEGDTSYLNPAICKTLYRILKEATGNALRHGRCSEILVSLEITPFNSTLKVSDNGQGFDLGSSLNLYSAGNRLGLVNMRELAVSLQGNLQIESKPGKGTEVTCSIPTSPVSVT